MYFQLTSLLCLSALTASSFALYTDNSPNSHRVVKRHSQIARGLAHPALAASQDLKVIKRDASVKNSKQKRCKAKAKPAASLAVSSAAVSASDDTSVTPPRNTTTTPPKVIKPQKHDNSGTDADIAPKVTKPATTKAQASSGDGDGGSGGSSGGKFDPSVNHTGGDATFYAPGLGACGGTNGPNDLIAAMAFGLFDTFAVDGNPNHNSVCNKKVRATIAGKGTVDVTIVDRCAGCMMSQSLDFSPHAFDILTDNGEAVGRFSGVLEWHFL